MDEQEREKERARDAMSEAVALMVEAGYSEEEVRKECDYCLETNDA